MDVCSGSRNDKHAEIAHGEGSSACPLCEMKIERNNFESELEKVKSDLESLKAAHELVCGNLDELREKTKHMKWATETVEEPRT